MTYMTVSLSRLFVLKGTSTVKGILGQVQMSSSVLPPVTGLTSNLFVYQCWINLGDSLRRGSWVRRNG